jgi:hypothetical protein
MPRSTFKAALPLSVVAVAPARADSGLAFAGGGTFWRFRIRTIRWKYAPDNAWFPITLHRGLPSRAGLIGLPETDHVHLHGTAMKYRGDFRRNAVMLLALKHKRSWIRDN